MTIAELIKALEEELGKMPQDVEVYAKTNVELNPIKNMQIMHIEIAFPTHTHDQNCAI